MAIKSFSSDSTLERENFSAWVQLLLPTLPVTRIKGIPPLYYAASFGLTATVQYLIDMGANIEARGGRHGATPLDIASCRGHVEVVKILLESGADPYAPDESLGLNSLARAHFNGHEDVLQTIQAWIRSAGGTNLKP